MLNQENVNRFITELKKRLTVKDSSCTVSYSNDPTGGIVVRVDYDTGRDHYSVFNTNIGVSWIVVINF